jgi:hypothetical protein
MNWKLYFDDQDPQNLSKHRRTLVSRLLVVASGQSQPFLSELNLHHLQPVCPNPMGPVCSAERSFTTKSTES